jgi:BirA family biotin operon repressor/biotin-[acetyl-CoA-carboxylase] ligase
LPDLPDDIYRDFPFISLETVDSTNNYALQLIHAGLAQHGMAIFAHEQTAGKGQRQKTWHAAAGENILMSLLLRPEGLSITDQPALNAAVALGTHDFFSRYAGDDTKIKWPNDLYWQDRKAVGILVENIISTGTQSAAWKWAVAGIGININQTSFNGDFNRRPVSLRQITGRSFDTALLARELRHCVLQQFETLKNEGAASILEHYNQRLYKLHEKVKLKKDNRLFESVIKGVSADGRLITFHGIEETFAHGEVEWIIP